MTNTCFPTLKFGAVKWKGYPDKADWTWEPEEKILEDNRREFHEKHSGAPRRIHAILPFREINHIQTTKQAWTRGKVSPEPSEKELDNVGGRGDVTPPEPKKEDDDGWGPIVRETWTDSIIKRNDEHPEESEPPKKPLRAFSKPTDEGHALMHWSFCRSYNCPYHRGEQSWHC